MGYNKNGKYSQSQIVDMLYAYMVEKQSAAYVCESILHMERSRIGSPRQAWRILQPYYQAYGFMKRYGNGMAFRKIQKDKLRRYVNLYWDKRATEKDLIAFFPEILEDLNSAKIEDEERPVTYSTSQNSGGNRSQENSEASFQRREPTKRGKNSYSANQNNSQSRTNTTTRQNRPKQYPLEQYDYRDMSNNKNYQNRNYQNNGSGEDAQGIVGIILFLIVAVVIFKSGIFSAIGHGILGIFGKLFWILELVFFYGGILLFVISLIKGTMKAVWKACLGFCLIGLGFGALAGGDIKMGLIMGVIGFLFTVANG